MSEMGDVEERKLPSESGGFFRVARRWDTLYLQQGRRGVDGKRLWRPFFVPYYDAGVPFYYIRPQDDAADTVREDGATLGHYFEMHGLIAAVEVDFSTTDRWGAEEIYEVLTPHELQQLKDEVESGQRKQYAWNTHGIWRKGRELAPGRHRYLIVRLYYPNDLPANGGWREGLP